MPREVPRLAAALLLALLAEGLAVLAPETLAWRGAGLLLAALAIGLSGFEVYGQGLVALRHGRLNIQALMTVAVTGAVLIGQWPEAAMVMALYALAEAIEGRAVGRARSAIQGLLDLAPAQAEVRQPDGRWATQPVAGLAAGAWLRVKPGERVPVDGVVREGHTSINQAPVTGESLPVDKAVGDAVFAGTLNLEGLVEVEASAAATDSTLARIVHAVEQAQASRAPIQNQVDRLAVVYTPAVFGLALAVALLGPWWMGWTWLQAVYQALVLLVIACPCALVISTPVAIVSGLTAAARRGILVKGGAYLVQARRLKVLALDKTGTLTEGRPRLVAWEALGEAAAADGVAACAAALAGASDHPVARAIATGLPQSLRVAEGLQAVPGQGLTATVDGQALMLGNRRMLEARGLATPELWARLQAHEARGHTVSLLATPERVLGLFVVADTLKPGACQAVAELQALGLRPVLLSGDNPATVQAVAKAAGISQAQGQLLPEDKRAAIQALQQQQGPTAMAGDGINDAPALAQSDLGLAMGAAGTDTAIEAADVVVMNDELGRIAELVRLSRATHAVLWQNIVLALGLKAAFLGLALAGQATMWMAVFADMGASLLVVFNGLRLLRGGVGP